MVAFCLKNEGILLANAIFSDLRPTGYAIRRAELRHASRFVTELAPVLP
jgi:hypothetical protein